MAISFKNEETHASSGREPGRGGGSGGARAARPGAPTPRLADRLVAIGADCAAHLKEPFRSVDHSDLLYGPDGLPR